MSALDDVVYYATITLDAGALNVDDARAELELLREASEAAFNLIKVQPPVNPDDCVRCFSCYMTAHNISDERCYVARILRTDPERAKRMGLGWAL